MCCDTYHEPRVKKKIENERGMALVSIRLPKRVVKQIDEVVRLGGAATRSEFVRMSVYKALREWYSQIELGE